MTMITGYDPTETEGWEKIGDGIGFRRFTSHTGNKGITFWHLTESGEWCGGACWFSDITKGRIGWKVISADGEPLTLTPSIDCSCHHCHGFIVNGTWNTA